MIIVIVDNGQRHRERPSIDNICSHVSYQREVRQRPELFRDMDMSNDMVTTIIGQSLIDLATRIFCLNLNEILQSIALEQQQRNYSAVKQLIMIFPATQCHWVLAVLNNNMWNGYIDKGPRKTNGATENQRLFRMFRCNSEEDWILCCSLSVKLPPQLSWSFKVCTTDPASICGYFPLRNSLLLYFKTRHSLTHTQHKLI